METHFSAVFPDGPTGCQRTIIYPYFINLSGFALLYKPKQVWGLRSRVEGLELKVGGLRFSV